MQCGRCFESAVIMLMNSLLSLTPKTKCIEFKPHGRPSNLRPKFSLDGQIIEYVEQYPHLGHILCEGQSDSQCVLFRRNQFIAQVNNVLCTFRKQKRVVQADLLRTFCSSFYGSVI